MGMFDREIIKAGAVPWFYGSRPGGWNKKEQRWVGMAKPIVELLTDRLWKKYQNEDAHHVFSFYRNAVAADASEIAHAIDKAINKRVPEAAVLRKWFRSLAKECADIGKQLRWETLLGLPVINAYYGTEVKNISTKFKGKRRRVKLAIGNTPNISKADAIKGAAANYVHSVDALHLHMIALAADAEGIEMVSVHDCFGTVAPHAARLREIISDTFIKLHDGNHLIDSLWASAKKILRRDPPARPKIGTAIIAPNFRAFS
jgi:DNA-directed RNA polymerase